MDLHRPLPEQPIPDNAKKVFAGKIFDTYQWPQRLYDGTEVTFEAIRRPDSVNILPITDEGKIILTKQEQPGMKPFIGVLGGRMDEGESPLQTAERELLEEAGRLKSQAIHIFVIAKASSYHMISIRPRLLSSIRTRTAHSYCQPGASAIASRSELVLDLLFSTE